jgi:hypothetical protein
MRPELPDERDHGVADGVMLLSTLCVAVAAWSCLANLSPTALWKFYGCIGVTFFFALAGLTRRSGWASALRFLLGMWLLMTPTIFGLTASASARWLCLATGVLLIALSVPRSLREKGRHLLRQPGGRRSLSLPL